MPVHTNHDEQRLLHMLRAVGLPALVRNFGPQTLFVCESAILRLIENISGRLKCKTAAPKDAFSEIDKNTKRIVVFSLGNEWALVCALREEKPECSVFSTQYQLLANTFERVAQVAPLPALKPNAKPPVIMISTPGSDADYVIQKIVDCGLLNFAAFQPAPVISSARLVTRFRSLRFLDHLRRYMSRTDYPALHLDTEFLEAIYNGKLPSIARAQSLMNASKTKLIRFRSDNKLTQSGIYTLLQNTKFRSIWSIPGSFRQSFTGQRKLNYLAASSVLQKLIAHERWLDAVTEGVEQCFTISLEQFIDNPSLVLEELAVFLEVPPPNGSIEHTYRNAYEAMPKLCSILDEYRREMIDRTGLNLSPPQR